MRSLVDPAVPVGVPLEDVAGVPGGLAVQEEGEGGGAEVEVLPAVGGRQEGPVPGGVVGVGHPGVVGIAGVLVVVPGPEGDGARIDGVPGHPVGVGPLHEEPVGEGALQGDGSLPGVAVVLVLQDDGAGDVGVDPVPRGPPGPVVHPAEPGAGFRQVGIDVVDPVHVPAVQELRRSHEPPGEPLVHGQVRPPDLGEAEAGVGEGQPVARRRVPGDVGGLPVVRVRVEGASRGVRELLEPGEHPVLPDLVGDPDVGRAPGEDPGAAADLGAPVPEGIPVEAHPGGEEEVGVREGLGGIPDRVPVLIPEGESVHLGVAEAGVPEGGDVDAEPQGQAEVVVHPPLVLPVDPGVGHLQGLDGLVLPRDVGPPHLEPVQLHRRGGAVRVRQVVVGVGVEVLEGVVRVDALGAGEEDVLRLVELQARPEGEGVPVPEAGEVVLELEGAVPELVVGGEGLEAEAGVDRTRRHPGCPPWGRSPRPGRPGSRRGRCSPR
jgi:hypothetical protein